jgi:hypothetical protein
MFIALLLAVAASVQQEGTFTSLPFLCKFLHQLFMSLSRTTGIYVSYPPIRRMGFMRSPSLGVVRSQSLREEELFMRPSRLLLVSIALLVALMGVTTFVGVPPAAANALQQHQQQVTCSGDGCDGKDPAVTGCAADAYPVQTATLSTAYVQLRYSPRCGTNWGRVLSRIGLAHLYVRVDRDDRLSYFSSISSGTLLYSPMVYAPHRKARACGSANSPVGCTAFV